MTHQSLRKSVEPAPVLTSYSDFELSTPFTEAASPKSSNLVGPTTLRISAREMQATTVDIGISDEEMKGLSSWAEPFLLKYMDQKEFANLLGQNKIDDIRDIRTSEYWMLYRDYVKDRIDYLRSEAEKKNTPLNEKKTDFLEVLANSPLFITSQEKLNTIRPKIKESGFRALSDQEKKEYEASLRNVTQFNNMLRNFGHKYNPKIDQLKECLAEMFVYFVPENEQPVCNDYLLAALRGARHELGFQQLLTLAGIEYVPGTNDDDIKGIDLRIREPGFPELRVDIKASKRGVEEYGHGNGFVSIRPDGKLALLSPFDDKDFEDDRFYVSPEILEKKSHRVREILAMLRNASQTK